jgi:hypothetical protein
LSKAFQSAARVRRVYVRTACETNTDFVHPLLDLYRITPTGIENESGAGAQPQELINYVQQTRNAIRGTPLDGKPIGHVDTWTVFVNATNNDFISTLDFLGMDAYPYFQSTMANDVGAGSQLFFDAYHQTVAAAQGKPVWVTETGWPVSGETINQAVPNSGNARIYWEDVTCQLVADNVNLYYYTLQDVQYGNPSPSFGIKPAGDLQTIQPLFDLSCPANARPVSPIYPLALSSSFSPLLFFLLYNLSIAWSLVQYLMPAVYWRCDCPCMNTTPVLHQSGLRGLQAGVHGLMDMRSHHLRRCCHLRHRLAAFVLVHRVLR